MLFSQRLSAATLAALCHVLRHNLAAGLPLTRVFRQQAERGPKAVRPAATRIAIHLERGESLRHALKDETHTFPPLFLALAAVGEKTGNLPEVFAELEKYYRLEQQLTRQIRAQAFGPAVQWALAVLIFGLVISVLGALGTSGPAVFGLTGVAGGVAFVLVNAGLVTGLYLTYLLLTRVLGGSVGLQRLLLALPGIGPCLRSLATGRFALALALTNETALSTGKALRHSLQATGNAAFAAWADAAVAVVERGDDVTLALTAMRLFPADFLAVVAVAEEAGRIPEAMRKQAEAQFEDATFRLKSLARLATGLVWLAYALFMALAIFRLAHIYTSALGG